MPTERWQRLERLFIEAREQPPEARLDFLRRACGPDPTLEQEARSLLEAAERSGEFLNGPALEALARQVAVEGLSLRPGDRLGPYEIQALLGVGGMGEVYRGRDTRLGRDVALKVISPRLVDEPSLRRRFEIEARAASALNHPSIVTVYDVGESGGVSWIAMEWVDGRTLRQAISDGPLSLRDTVAILRQIAEGLAVAHAKGIVHRDLKPENVMMTVDGRAKVLDFGLARQGLGEAWPAPISQIDTVAHPSEGTREGTILGTVGYMSPEQASGRAAEFRSDQFALGLIAYEVLTGRRAFTRPTAAETLAAIIGEEPVPLSSLRSDVPEVLRRLIATCLAKQPENRFASTRDLAAALESLGTPISAAEAPAALSAAPALEPAPPPRLRRSRFVLGALLAVALAIASFVRLHVPRHAIESLAVLPFENASKDPEADYLGDGLTESLIDQMSRLPSLKVMARATVFRLKAADPQQAGRELGVGAVLTGTVSRRGDRLSISAELVEIPSGARLWGEKYDRPFADLLRVQDSIASEISDGLRLRLSGQEKRALGRHGTESAEAYELFLKARFFLTRETEADDLEARRLFLASLARDPDFVDARLGVAATYARSAGSGYARPANAWAHAEEELRKALALDPGNALARAGLAARRFLFEWDWTGAEREFRELSTDPRALAGTQFHAIAVFLWARGRPEEAVSLMERALRADPGNLESRVMLADFLSQAGRLEEAVDSYRAIAATEPSDPRLMFGLAEVLKRRGDLAGAIQALRKAYELTGEDQGAKSLATARTEKDYERAEVEVARVRLAALESLAQERYVSPLDLARLCAQAGEREKAFASLGAAVVERSPLLVGLKVDRAWDRIRDDPRFAGLVQRVGIP